MTRRMPGLLLAAIVLAGCGGATIPPVESLSGGVLATFEVSGETFRVWLSAPSAIRQVLDVRDGLSSANIPNGTIRQGPGYANHNLPWKWHYDGREFQMAEATIEICDGRPSLVDDLLDEYLRVGRFCPWGARLVSVEDLR